MDKVNELGKYLKDSKDKADLALKRQRPQFPIGEIGRDIFDAEVPFRMHFTVPRKGMSVAANLQFEYPPPDMGLGNCCADCYCALCEQFMNTDVGADQTLLLSYPYVSGSVNIYDPAQKNIAITETDPEAGIIDLNYTPAGTEYITICYVHQYESQCTTNEVLYTCDNFDRVSATGFGTGNLGTWDYYFSDSNFFSTDGTYGTIQITEGSSSLTSVPQTITLPYEVLVTIEADGNTTFSQWSGTATNPAGSDDFEFTLGTSGANTSYPNIYVQGFMSGIYPATVLGLGASDARSNVAGGPGTDWDDVEITWPLTTQRVKFYVRLYIDTYGVYGRVWLDGQEEPTSGASVLVPYWSNPTYNAQWLATGAGKGEGWSMYKVNLTGKVDISKTTLFAGGYGVAGTDTLMHIDSICII